MSVALRSLALGGAALTLALMSGCGSSSYGKSAGASSVGSGGSGTAGSGGGSTTAGFNGGGGNSMGSHNSVIATPESNLVSVQMGQKQTVAITFTSSDGQPITGFGLTNTTLPDGWTGATNFGCARVSSGSSCVLNLVYAPTQYESGKSVTLNFIYVDNSGTPVTNAMAGAAISMSFNYQGTTDDNVTSLVAPAGQIVATTNGGSQAVTVTFETDDGHPATNLVVTNPTLLTDLTPPATAGCATVSSGMPCTLTWTYQPTVPESGIVTFDYTYSDDSGTAKSGSFNVAYAAMADNAVTYAVDPITNPIDVPTNGTQTVVVTFVTNDGYPATGFSIGTSAGPYDLSLLGSAYAGWSAAGSSFSCTTVDGGTGCQLTLTYSPTAPDTNAVTIPYTYTNNAGVSHDGTLSIPYHSS